MSAEKGWRVTVSVDVMPIACSDLTEQEVLSSQFRARETYELHGDEPLDMAALEFRALQCGQSIVEQARAVSARRRTISDRLALIAEPG